MAIIHIEESEAARDFRSLIAKAGAGDTVIIENGAIAIAIMEAANPPRRTIEECIALLPEDSKATWT